MEKASLLQRVGRSLRRQVVGIVHNKDIQGIRDLIYLAISQIGIKLIWRYA